MAKRKKPSARRSQQRTMLDAAKSGAVQVQKIALKAATEAASAAAEAAVQAVMRTLSRESAARGRRATPKRSKTTRRAARKQRR